jgi:hypothetical protein
VKTLARLLWAVLSVAVGACGWYLVGTAVWAALFEFERLHLTPDNSGAFTWSATFFFLGGGVCLVAGVQQLWWGFRDWRKARAGIRVQLKNF